MRSTAPCHDPDRIPLEGSIRQDDSALGHEQPRLRSLAREDMVGISVHRALDERVPAPLRRLRQADGVLRKHLRALQLCVESLPGRPHLQDRRVVRDGVVRIIGEGEALDLRFRALGIRAEHKRNLRNHPRRFIAIGIQHQRKDRPREIRQSRATRQRQAPAIAQTLFQRDAHFHIARHPEHPNRRERPLQAERATAKREHVQRRRALRERERAIRKREMGEGGEARPPEREPALQKLDLASPDILEEIHGGERKGCSA